MKLIKKEKWVLLLSLVLLCSVGTWMLHAQSLPVSASTRYVSGLLLAQQDEVVAGLVVNVGSSNATYRIVIYQYLAGVTPIVVSDTGTQSIPPGGKAGASHLLPTGTVDHWGVEITVSSSAVIPSVELNSPCSGPVVRCPRLWLYGSQLSKFKQEF